MDSLFNQIICLENLFDSWEEFKKGKRKKLDVSEFENNLEDEVFRLHRDLKTKTYQHSNYTSFYITDPKLRHIHKAIVRDRIVHHAVYRVLYPIFDKSFIYDSYSCRNGKGTHKAVKRLEAFTRIVSKNYMDNCTALKCDVCKFFNSIDHQILMRIIKKKVTDSGVLNLIENIINSFEKEKDKGIPIGNLTSQLFANIYLNELDQFVKHTLKVKYYIRYCDDFVIVDYDEEKSVEVKNKIEKFLNSELKLTLHKDKVITRKLNQGVDFLGYIALPHYRILRTKTKKRMLKKVNRINFPSYLGLLKHSEGYKLRMRISELVMKTKQ
jgi:retron-type reverse transcriptase